MPFPRGVEGARHQAARQGPTLLLRVDFFSDSVRGRIVGRYSSGQRGLTVNQVASPSQVRILACPPLRTHPSGRSSGVELQPSKLAVASSNLVARSTPRLMSAHVAQLAEHVLGKDEVTRSIRVVGSTITPAHPRPAKTGPFPVGLLEPLLRSNAADMQYLKYFTLWTGR